MLWMSRSRLVLDHPFCRNSFIRRRELYDLLHEVPVALRLLMTEAALNIKHLFLPLCINFLNVNGRWQVTYRSSSWRNNPNCEVATCEE